MFLGNRLDVHFRPPRASWPRPPGSGRSPSTASRAWLAAGDGLPEDPRLPPLFPRPRPRRSFGPETGERRLDVAKWGLVPFFTKDLAKARKPINARSETVARSPLFKEAFARRRCLVPAAAYCEWRHDPSGKTPFAIARSDGEPVALGGMWEAWRSDGETLRTFATLTTEANRTLALIQDRMPVIIERADWR